MERRPRPVLIASALAAILTALVTLGSEFGLSLTPTQTGALIGFVGTIAPLVAAIWSQERVTPLANPVDVQGNRLVTVDKAFGDNTFEGDATAPEAPTFPDPGSRNDI